MAELIYKDESYRIMGACFEVYKEMGCGFLEAVYQECLTLEFQAQGIAFRTQCQLALRYKGQLLEQKYIPDFICFDKIIVEIKAVKGLCPEHHAQVHNYPHCSTDGDPTLLVGWAGWDHLQQATALVHYYDARKREGWNAKRLTPLLAGLDQLLPWIHQWHPEIDKEFGETAGQSFQTMLEQDAHELGLTPEDIRNWKPESKPRNTRKTRKKKEE